MQIDGKNILVVGLARSGAAAAEFLLSRGARVVVNDAKPESELKGVDSLRAKGAEVVAGSHPPELFEKSEMIVVSPGVPLALEPFRRARAAGAPIISEVELAARFLRGRLIGVTGSNGKTTTTTLAGELLAGAGLHTQVGGNIGVKFYNDSNATNVDAAIKCIEAFDGGVNVILGGKDKGGDYSPLAPVARARCSNVILIGAAADKIAAALRDARPMRRASTMEEAVEIGLEVGKPGEIVLLAPACASFDMFDNYEHRGRVFKDAVRRLGSG